MGLGGWEYSGLGWEGAGGASYLSLSFCRVLPDDHRFSDLEEVACCLHLRVVFPRADPLEELPPRCLPQHNRITKQPNKMLPPVCWGQSRCVSGRSLCRRRLDGPSQGSGAGFDRGRYAPVPSRCGVSACCRTLRGGDTGV